jgi:hypothetical protein
LRRKSLRDPTWAADEIIRLREALSALKQRFEAERAEIVRLQTVLQATERGRKAKKKFTVTDALESLDSTAAGLRAVRLDDDQLQSVYRRLGKTIRAFTRFSQITAAALAGPKPE